MKDIVEDDSGVWEHHAVCILARSKQHMAHTEAPSPALKSTPYFSFSLNFNHEFMPTKLFFSKD